MTENEEFREMNKRLIKMEIHIEYLSKFVMIILDEIRDIKKEEKKE